MHPTMMMALADEASRGRRSEGQKMRARVPSERRQGSPAPRPVRALGRRLVTGVSLRAGVS
jgi:hypothetical protein